MAEGSGRPNARIYWYSDISNNYDGIERFSKQVLNPLQVTVVMDTEAPVTGVRTTPRTPDGRNGYFITPVRIDLFTNEPSTTYYRWDGGVWQTYSSPLSAPEGAHTLEYYSVDGGGNAEAIKRYYTKVDLAPPASFGLLSPRDGYLGNNPNLTFSWLPSTDIGSGIEAYDLFIDGLPVTTINGSETSLPLLSPLADGTHNWFVRARDYAGNYSDSATWKLTVDTAPPTTSITLDPAHPNGDNGWYRTSVSASLSASDAISGVVGTEYSLDNGGTWTPYSSPFAIDNDGTDQIIFRSTDRAGNLESAKSRTIKIDKTAPEAGIYFDPEIKDLAVVGFDNLGGTVRADYIEKDLKGKPNEDDHDNGEDDEDESGGWKLRVYTLTDEAGNTLTLSVKVKREGQELKAGISSLTYNGAQESIAQENELKFEWSVNEDGSIKMLNQKVEFEDKLEVKARYDRKKNITPIKIEDKGGEKKITRPGLALIRIVTSHGDLGLKY
ncbi:MAG: Ig-like domain-containing protein [Actinobacteria bacterium]|nr:Ig-like domain-containing protein [Actinomycetota bacterium]